MGTVSLIGTRTDLFVKRVIFAGGHCGARSRGKAGIPYLFLAGVDMIFPLYGVARTAD